MNLNVSGDKRLQIYQAAVSQVLMRLSIDIPKASPWGWMSLEIIINMR